MNRVASVPLRRMTQLALVSTLAPAAALGQPGGIKMLLYATPPSPTMLGRQATVGVRPATPGTTYRYVARMLVTGSGMQAAGTACDVSQAIGTGNSVVWKPASGAHRLTVYASRGLLRDSTSISYQVDAPTAGFLNVTVRQYPPVQPGKLELSLQTANRGPGHRYQWVVRFSPAPGAPPTAPVYWTGDTPIHLYTVPFIVQPGTYNISVRVGIHTGDPCRISEISIGSANAQVIQ